MATTKSRRALKWVIAAVVAVVILVVAIPFIYINFISDDAPDRLELSQPSATTAAPNGTAAPAAGIAGTWTVGTGSTAGYRVDEVLFGQNNTAAGRTSDVTGTMVIEGTTVKSADMSVDLTTVESGEERRDGQFRGRIMNTAEFPTATFTLTTPIELGTEPAEGTPITVPATGDLTVHGVTKSVTTDLNAQRTGDTIEVQGSIPVTFSDYEIPSPSFGGISVEDHGEIEFLLKMTQT
jgi:polyisoprenoid-binding protein YceI